MGSKHVSLMETLLKCKIGSFLSVCLGGWVVGGGWEWEGKGCWWLVVGWLVGIKAKAFICGYKHLDAKAHSSASHLRETARNNQERASALPSGALMSGTV